MIRKAIIEDYEILTKYYHEFHDKDVDPFSSDPFKYLYVYELDRKVVGFINYSIIYDRAELNYLYVDGEYRKRNIASEMLEFFIVDCVDNNCKNITLEVSDKNIGAINLYKKFCFEVKAVRKNYYKDSDGLLMMRELIESE